MEDNFSSFKNAPVVRVIARQLSGKNCLAAIFASRHQYASPGPLGMPTILDVKFGREFFGWAQTLEKQGRKIRYQNSPSKFAEKFAGNLPKLRRAKIKNSSNPLCITSGPKSVNMIGAIRE